MLPALLGSGKGGCGVVGGGWAGWCMGWAMVKWSSRCGVRGLDTLQVHQLQLAMCVTVVASCGPASPAGTEGSG